MRRYSANMSLIPDEYTIGKYTLWVSVTLWENGHAVQSIPVFSKDIREHIECAPGTHGVYAFMLESVDLAYQEITERYSAVCRILDETNARPSSASTN